MKKLFVLMLIAAVTFSYAANLKLGKPLTIKDKSSISKVLKDPSKFEGKEILVEGKILEVCQDKGCWIEVAGEKDGEKIKVKVEDGVIVFPKDSKGKKVSVQGVLEEVTAANSCGDHEKEAKVDEKKDKEECASKKEGEEGGCCPSEEKAAKVYQLKGIGAVIK